MKFSIDKITEAAILIILLILSALFYMERTVILDVAYLLFNILKTGDLAIQNNRFIAALPQSIPFFCAKIGLSIKFIMVLFSMAFVGLNILYYFLLKYIIKSDKMALVLVLMQFFVVTHTFYWIQSELLEAVSLSILFYGIILSLDFNKKNIFYIYSLLFVIIFTLVYAHYAVIFPIGFMFVYFLILDLKKYKYTIPIFLCFMVVYIIKLKFITTHSYDISAIDRINNLITFFPNYLQLDSFSRFKGFLIGDYYLLLAGFIIIIGYYIWKMKYLSLAFYVLSSLGYLLIINVLFQDSKNQFYIESFYIVLGLMTIIPLAYEIFPLINKKWLYISLICLFIIRVVDITSIRSFYTSRIDFLSHTLHQLNEKNEDKIIFHATKEAKDALRLTWGSSYESWLLSTLKYGQSKSIIFLDNPKDYQWAQSNKKAFLSMWGQFDYSEFDKRYFIFGDTTSTYKTLKIEEQ